MKKNERKVRLRGIRQPEVKGNRSLSSPSSLLCLSLMTSAKKQKGNNWVRGGTTRALVGRAAVSLATLHSYQVTTGAAPKALPRVTSAPTSGTSATGIWCGHGRTVLCICRKIHSSCTIRPDMQNAKWLVLFLFLQTLATSTFHKC